MAVLLLNFQRPKATPPSRNVNGPGAGLNRRQRKLQNHQCGTKSHERASVLSRNAVTAVAVKAAGSNLHLFIKGSRGKKTVPRAEPRRTLGGAPGPRPSEADITRMFSRRSFLTIAGAPLVANRALWPMDTVPSNLDHILLGSSDLDRGIAWMEERTGVRAVFGGVHPGRGTRNALLQLGQHRYLEILAPGPDPQQASQRWYADLRVLRVPRLVAWAVHTADIVTLAREARAAGFAITGPDDGSRTRPDGKMLRWEFSRLQDDRGGLLPFFIEWDRESVHPSVDAPAGCRLDRFLLQSEARPDLTKVCEELGVDVAVEHGKKPLLRARISSPKGEVELTS